MGCGRCGQRRREIGEAGQAVAAGDLRTAGVKLGEVGRTMSEDAAKLGRAMVQRIAASHARLKR